MNQFKIQNSLRQGLRQQNSKLKTATPCEWGFYLPWETRIFSLTRRYRVACFSVRVAFRRKGVRPLGARF
ncbi:hypothetical protein [Nostoc parmelioides]|uniref:Uncharacterized protein n=1 Tax=Nostoc parmelioides FACHB-3921 TaxID=2692909 RepID=A0ABR8BHP0_9NOSO|nr:hypothetical protein [Nostoc parmelioides]MBD2253633.1 hypothetical protein [Nostoc parmelioides FACHB-3921]